MSKAPQTPAQLTADRALRSDVRLLGDLLGQVISDLGGPPLLARVEGARQLARDRRAGNDEAGQELQNRLAGLSPAAARELTRAFSSFFSLANLAEQVHRIRRRREQSLEGVPPQPGSLSAVLRELAGQGLVLSQIREILGQLEVMPVFTAHPTRAMRRTLLVKSQRMARSLQIRLDQPEPTPREAARIQAELRRQIELAWQTEEQPTARPTVADEVEYVLFHLIEVVYVILPGFYASLSRALEEAYGPGAGADLPCPLIRFGTWVGGDMDGNPNVGAHTVRATLERQRQLILGRYRDELAELAEEFSQSEHRVSVSRAVHARVTAYRELLPERAGNLPRRSADMPYRLLLTLMQYRMEATMAETAGAYESAETLLEDLALIRTSLLAPGGGRGGLQVLLALEQRVRTFGFHLATLDLRQDSELHRRVAGRLLDRPGFMDLDPTQRADELRAALEAPLDETATTRAESDDPESVRCLDVLRTIKDMRTRHGARAFGPYIISMAQGADDLLALLLLARHAGLEREARIELDVSPLFETVDDLLNARSTVSSMFADPVYREHLRGRGNRQLIMLGYSDSSKISGIAASRWALYQVQEELGELADEAGVELSFFHGRGGTVGRGGSKPRSAILADPCGALRGHLRLTEQGEIVHAKYGLRGLAERTLELLSGAVLQTTALCSPRSRPEPQWTGIMDLVASAGRADYQELVHHHPQFHDYFREATPIDVIERLEIGSRPPSRRSGRGVENLRAIPWGFSWTQNRHLLPGWYGVGRGLQTAAERFGADELARMAARWPFFANLLADLAMVLAKADLEIASRYAELAGPVGESVFPVIRERWLETRDWVLRLRGEDELLDLEPALQRSIRLRNPYVDPMSLLQVDLLSRWRASGREDRELETALFETVRGISQGMQNTG
ncbi:MAG: phosphoenolpyruvate carboxylase [Candidatus Cloacimonetes bacterium]|nr:phosphoenolpyruvate carboxylase [Candidatus Cloacimonadota bacterium]